ncbi:MAG: hypothetical protein ABI624_07105 [Casimicrobiaceae bacterium]
MTPVAGQPDAPASFDAFMAAAWNDHADRPQEVANRLAASLDVVATPDQVAPFARLVTHVFGEHLGQWSAGIALLDAVRGLPAFDHGTVAAGALGRSSAVLRYASGDHAALEPLSRDDRVAVLATVAVTLAGRLDFGPAMAAYAEALRLGAVDPPPGAPAIRALAIGGHSLAATLEQKKDRSGTETASMIAAAESGLRYWKQAGTWLEEERAEYRLARSLVQAGRAATAVASAQRCIAICAANDAPAFERFFGHAVLALAQRAAGNGAAFTLERTQARQQLDLVPADEQHWCAADLAELSD